MSQNTIITVTNVTADLVLTLKPKTFWELPSDVLTAVAPLLEAKAKEYQSQYRAWQAANPNAVRTPDDIHALWDLKYKCEEWAEKAERIPKKRIADAAKASTAVATTRIEVGGHADRTGTAAYNQQLNVNKTYPNRPNQGNMSLLGTETNISVAKLEADRNNNRMWVPSSAPPQIPSMEQFGQMSMPQTYDNNLNTERMDPAILNAFRQNPYTKSLNVY